MNGDYFGILIPAFGERTLVAGGITLVEVQEVNVKCNFAQIRAQGHHILFYAIVHFFPFVVVVGFSVSKLVSKFMRMYGSISYVGYIDLSGFGTLQYVHGFREMSQRGDWLGIGMLKRGMWS